MACQELLLLWEGVERTGCIFGRRLCYTSRCAFHTPWDSNQLGKDHCQVLWTFHHGWSLSVCIFLFPTTLWPSRGKNIFLIYICTWNSHHCVQRMAETLEHCWMNYVVSGFFIYWFLPIDWCWEVWTDYSSIFMPTCRHPSWAQSRTSPIPAPGSENYVFLGVVMIYELWFPWPNLQISFRKPSVHTSPQLYKTGLFVFENWVKSW